jgi:hypothetical protein
MQKDFDIRDYDAKVLAMYDPARFDPDNLFGRKKKKAAAAAEGKTLRQFKADNKAAIKSIRRSGTEKQAAARKAMATVGAIAAMDNKTPEEVSEQIANNNTDQLVQYVQDRGHVPVSNTGPELAAQATIIHEQLVEDRQLNGVPEYDVAEQAVFQDYTDYEEQMDTEPDEFGPEILGAIAGAAKNALAKINAKRAAKGKKPLFGGKKAKALTDKIKNAVDVKGTAEGVNVFVKTAKDEALNNPQDKTDLAILVQEGIKAAEKLKKQEYIKKYLPYAILLIVAVFLIGKSFK